MSLVAGASTQSRARRPLPPGAVRGVTLAARGITEIVRFYFEDEHYERRELLSWIGGQAGLLFGASPDLSDLPFDVAHLRETHGSYGHAAEYDLADALGEALDGCFTSDRLACRFFQNGGDACAAAVRIARAMTGRDAIATSGYHGAHTDFGHDPNWVGYPRANVELHRQFEFGDTAAMLEATNGAACIMIEVPAWDDEYAIASFLRVARNFADGYGIPLIMDEVVTGFRLGLGGACERYGVRADMACYGKGISAIGGVSAIVGNADMVGRLGGSVFFSTTFGGAPGPCAVAAATVRWLTAHRGEVYGRHTYGGEGCVPVGNGEVLMVSHSEMHQLGRLTSIGSALKDGFNERGIKCVGQPERSIFQFPSDAEWLDWCSRMIEQGVMVHRPNFPALIHSMADVERTMRAVEAVAHGK